MIEARETIHSPGRGLTRSTDVEARRTVVREPKLSHAARRLGRSGLREVMDLASRPGVLSFAVGLPAAEMFPREALAEATAQAVLTDPAALQYALPPLQLKKQIVEIMAWRGVRCRPEQVFLTAGAQQALDLFAHLLLNPYGDVMMEETIYDGIRMAVRRFEPRILTVPTNPASGIDVDAVAARLVEGTRPAFLYLIPESHNPLGVSLSMDKRRSLVRLARSYGIPLIEDDAYGLLGHAEPTLPALRALDKDWVFYVGSFSKILAPGLRAGWTVVPEALIPKLSMLKHASDIDTPSLGHRAVAGFLATGKLGSHLESLRQEYRRRLDAMTVALQAFMPSGVRWNRPDGGLYLWLELPQSLDATALLRIAVENEQVAFTPGECFNATTAAGSRSCLRLSFGSCLPETIEEGIRRLGRAIGSLLPPA